MSADIRDFSNFREFGGYIINGCYEFPVLNMTDKVGRNRHWKIMFRLIQNKVQERRKINWNTEIDVLIPITDEHLNGVSPVCAIGQIWTEQGISSTELADYKITRSSPTYVLCGKNIGKKNETNVFTQSLILARSKYLKKKQECLDTSINHRYYPVAVHKYEDKPRDTKNKIIYPVAVQRKIDGGRVVTYKDDKNNVIAYTRKLKNIDGNLHILEDLKLLFSEIEQKYPGLYLDGEFYKHGLSLQEISGKMRKVETDMTNLLEYHIFDLFFPFSDTVWTFENRNSVLCNIFDIIKPLELKYIKKVDTYIAADKKQENDLYDMFLNERYEGSVLKNLHSIYEFGKNKEIRSYQMRKRKPRHSGEYKIVNYTQGNQGKDVGAIIWILKTPETKKNKSMLFTSTPVGMSNEERYSLFRNMTEQIFNDNYKNKMMTVEYDDISIDGVPLRAKTKGLRFID